jgi:hypothetical protein
MSGRPLVAYNIASGYVSTFGECLDAFKRNTLTREIHRFA